MDMTNVEFLWASDEINSHSNDYWLRVMDIARKFNVPRIIRCCTIMGRAETDDLSAAQIFYPAMQCADIFHLKVSYSSLGSFLFQQQLQLQTAANRPRPTDRRCSQRRQGAECASTR